MAKILIADDHHNLLTLTSDMFKDMGMEVISAVNGEEAIEKAKAEKPDIIITDVIMPKKDGFEVCRTIRNTPEISDTPIIILSAMGDEYNKINGFNEGADDYVTKPFNTEELKARVKSLLLRYKSRKNDFFLNPAKAETNEPASDFERISSGLKELDQSLNGGFPRGSNILVIGELGSGKSEFSRRFICSGLENKERCMFVALDDAPNQIRNKLSLSLNNNIKTFEDLGIMRFVDAYSWSSLTQLEDEPFAVNGILELNQLSGVISDAGYELGQTVQNKLGGRRVIDSISSLLINFELPSVQRFINQIARTALAFGGVTTLFILESGTISDQVLNNIKYIMDGIVEFSQKGDMRLIRVQSMKWAKYSNEWKELKNFLNS